MTSGAPTSAPPSGYRTYLAQEQITGEAVAIDMPTATLVSRAIARFIDTVVAVLVAVLLALLVFGVAAATDLASGASLRIMMIISIVTTTIVLPVGIETWTRGRSVGKIVMSLRTVRDDGGPISLRQSIGRALIGWVEIYVLTAVPAVISALVTPRAQRLGDLAMGSFVISEKHVVRLPPPVQTPDPLAPWVRSADLATLPDGLALSIRQFLPRAASMTPSSREATGQRLVGEALRYVAPQPPPGFHPEYVLAAIMADRRRRDTARLERDEALRTRVLGAKRLSQR